MNYLDLFESFTQKVIDNTNNTTQEEKRIDILDPKVVIETKIDDFINNIVVPRMTYGQSDDYSLPKYYGKQNGKTSGLPIYIFDSDNLNIINKYGDSDDAYFAIYVEGIDDDNIYFNVRIGYAHQLSYDYDYEINDFIENVGEYMMDIIDDVENAIDEIYEV